jgi:hypothetical protein
VATHIRILGWLHIAFGIFGLFAALVAFGGTLLGGIFSGSVKGMIGMGMLAGFVGVLVALMSIPTLLAGYGQLKFRPWARILTIVLAIIELINFPFGTILGVYSLWVLLSSEGAAQFQTQGGF